MFFALLSFSGSLGKMANTPGHAKCVSVNNQEQMTQSTLINLHRN